MCQRPLTAVRCRPTPPLGAAAPLSSLSWVGDSIDTDACSLTILAPPLACSLRHNKIGAQGASALAAVLKETNITNLEYAAAPIVFAFVSAPADTPALSPSPLCLSCTVSKRTTSDPRAQPRSPLSSRRR